MADLTFKKRVRADSDELDLESSEAKRLREDLLEFFDDTDPTTPSTQDLDSVIRSLQEEISASSSPAPLRVTTSDSGQIGYLLGASDDELGLPPTEDLSSVVVQEAEMFRVPPESASGIGELWGFEDQMPSYDSFGLGNGFGYESNTDYVAFDGLFDHSDVYYDSNEFSDSWRQETMPAAQ
ncbi:uncharacterized protein LOC130721061 [Lotus japonicus]|uniref:uncharacterized protein LOC130721061 n=1 Tax=Lotus japonicus TaxID=34305 RepID=UPI0025867007|nr:uncharacterized protein LOC130721061 [Lotus japonicus]